jgi:putative transposase
VRYFTDGAILGSRIFVNEAFQRHQAHFSRSRLTGARPMKGQWGGLCSVRRLRLAVITPPRAA